MRTSPTERKPLVVVLTGAGISIPIGIPAMHGMFKAFMNRAESGISVEDRNACRLFTDELGVPEDLEEFLVAANAVTEFDSTSLSRLIERSISSRKQAKVIQEYRSRFSHHVGSAENLRSRILEFMARKCFQFDRDLATALFGGVVTSLAKKGYPVYTTNYDFSFEHVAIENHIPINDNFTNVRQRNLWNPSIDFSVGNALTLVKLHGSVTWYVSDDGQIEKIYSNTDINPIGKPIDRIVIAPTRFKDIYAQHFFALYSHFLTNLATAGVLIITGHSLRDDYLRAAIIERVRKRRFHLVVIGPSFPETLPAELAPARLGTVGEVTHVPFKFEEFSDELGSILSSVEPDQIATACAEVVQHRRSRKTKIAIKGKIGRLKVNTNMSFTATVDGYLERNQKPASIRVWVAATYNAADGTTRNQVSEQFLEDSHITIGQGLSGLLREEVPINFTVPEYSDWVGRATKVSLHVAIMRNNVQKPSAAKESDILAADNRVLAYVG